MRPFLFACFCCIITAAASAAPATGVVHPAPDFTFMAESKTRTLRSLRGQAVILIIAESPKNKAFKKQLKNLAGIYQELASKQVILVAALASPEGPIPTNIPVVIASNGTGTAAAYGVQKGFQIAIIGRDGNLDYQTGNVLAAERVRDVVQNSFDIQTSARKGN